MRSERITIQGIPAILWGEPSGKIYLHVHGKMSRKEYAAGFAEIAQEKGWQTLSFDLPQHGERAAEEALCILPNGIHDLTLMAQECFSRWEHAALYACSLGAWFSLNCLQPYRFERCLLQSPILDMKWLVAQMMRWAGVTEKDLEERGEIPTQLDTLRWSEYRYIRSHTVTEWPFPTAILYGALDQLQPLTAMQAFSERFGASLTVAPQSDHPFMAPEDQPVVEQWLRENV